MTWTSAPAAQACWINPPAPRISSSGCGATTMMRSLAVIGGNGFWAKTVAPATSSGSRMTALRRILPADALVNETQFRHLLRLEQIAAIEHDRLGHQRAQLLEIKLAKFIPLRADHQRINPRGSGIRIAAE